MKNRDTLIGIGAFVGLLAVVTILYQRGAISEELFLSAAVTIFGWFVLVWLAAIQIAHTYQNALDAQRELTRDQLWISLYREVVPLIADAKSASISLNVQIMMFPSVARQS